MAAGSEDIGPLIGRRRHLLTVGYVALQQVVPLRSGSGSHACSFCSGPTSRHRPAAAH